jgi:branched-chain amino acid transport system ATP-binding protein
MLEVADLSVSYGAIKAVRGVTFRVEEGEAVAILGPNGAGKSTILRTISGLLRAKSGSIRFRDSELTQRRPPQIAALGIAHVPEGRGILADMTVEENLLLGAVNERDGRVVQRRLTSMLERFPLIRDRREALGGTLSGGEQQVLAIARGLMADPRLLLLDEPSMGLAPLLVGQIFGLIDEIKRKGLSILLVEQNAFQALRVADRAYVLERGSLVLEGAAADLLRDERVRASYLGVAVRRDAESV